MIYHMFGNLAWPICEMRISSFNFVKLRPEFKVAIKFFQLCFLEDKDCKYQNLDLIYNLLWFFLLKIFSLLEFQECDINEIFEPNFTSSSFSPSGQLYCKIRAMWKNNTSCIVTTTWVEQRSNNLLRPVG